MMKEFLQREWKYFVGLAVVMILLVFSYFEYWQWKQHIMSRQDIQPSVSVTTSGESSKPGETQVVYLQGQNTNTKEIIYVPKEIDPVTGQQEQTDVQLDTKNKNVYVKVNGRDFEVPADVQENSKFENGKLVITEDTQMRLNITSPKPSFNLGLGWAKDSPALQLNGPLYKNASWWVYGDKKTAAGGVQFPIMK
jgi:hypothetical protein